MNDVPQADLPPVDVSAFDVKQLLRLIPHRYPFMLLDRMVDVRYGHSATGIKNVTMNEPFFQGHFPGHPVMPGVLIVESMAQTAAALVISGMGEDAGSPIVYFMSIENAKFRKPVTPGDQLRLELVKDRKRGNVWRFNGTARVDGVVVAEASITAMIMDEVKPV
ncbi:3-hydroxyacyl-ACP dehydratase FabZ [Acidocella sp.]|uniref:3-hydroxyacyl-ACP dehydratase FabZ n=1 Tax=Acidocella sp. TaxID=50710 RepID=UPI0017CDD475|nr:3-hydroxyacyl-ACP dehydratase FabZ [Acidocella sp.]NNM55661.1 3-hydroxyacyl-ACP dehydratase FabZ [Acidocella sp.]